MKSFRAHLRIRYRPGILDPQAEATLSALQRLEFQSVQAVQFEKDLVISLKATGAAEAEKLVAAMAEKVLVNPVMEEYQIQIQAEG